MGEDERFPNGFTIRAEKCPNRRGVEAVVAHFMGRVATFDDLLPELDARRGRRRVGLRRIQDATGSTRRPPRGFAAVEVLVVQDLFPSPLSERATYRPARRGLCRARRLVREPGRPAADRSAGRSARRRACGPKGSLYWELLGRDGLYKPRRVLDEIAGEIPFFAAAAQPVPDRWASI